MSSDGDTAKPLIHRRLSTFVDVMPEHVHLLLSEPPRGTPSTVLQKLKLRVARKMRKRRRVVKAGQLRLLFERRGEALKAFWQARFYDFNVYSKGRRWRSCTTCTQIQ
jgi:putative transposase